VPWGRRDKAQRWRVINCEINMRNTAKRQALACAPVRVLRCRPLCNRQGCRPTPHTAAHACWSWPAKRRTQPRGLGQARVGARPEPLPRGLAASGDNQRGACEQQRTLCASEATLSQAAAACCTNRDVARGTASKADHTVASTVQGGTATSGCGQRACDARAAVSASPVGQDRATDPQPGARRCRL
jgi:hypothetical protein